MGEHVSISCWGCGTRMRLSEQLLIKLKGKRGKLNCKVCQTELRLDYRGDQLITLPAPSYTEVDSNELLSEAAASHARDELRTAAEEDLVFEHRRETPPPPPLPSEPSHAIPSLGDLVRQSRAPRAFRADSVAPPVMRTESTSLLPHTFDDEEIIPPPREESSPFAAQRMAEIEKVTSAMVVKGPLGLSVPPPLPVTLAFGESAGELSREALPARSKLQTEDRRASSLLAMGTVLLLGVMGGVAVSQGGAIGGKQLFSGGTGAAAVQGQAPKSAALPAKLSPVEIELPDPEPSPLLTHPDGIDEEAWVLDAVSSDDGLGASAATDPVATPASAPLALSQEPVVAKPRASANSKQSKDKALAEEATVEASSEEAGSEEAASESTPSEVAPGPEAEALPEFDSGAAKVALSIAEAHAAGCRGVGDPSGTARVVVTFAPSGRATQATISGPPFVGTPAGSCIASKFRTLAVRPFQGEHVTVTRTVVIR